ncbi:unnamed protein product [Prunus armeniaca]
MVQCEDLIYRFKRFNADKKLNLNFLREPPPLPERVTEDMVEAYLGEDAEAETSSGSESDNRAVECPRHRSESPNCCRGRSSYSVTPALPCLGFV